MKQCMMIDSHVSEILKRLCNEGEKSIEIGLEANLSKYGLIISIEYVVWSPHLPKSWRLSSAVSVWKG